MKTLARILLNTAIALSFAFASLAGATIIPPNYQGIGESGAELFTFTDFDNNFDDSGFSLIIEYGQFNTNDHEFGLYNYDRQNDLVGDMLAIFNSSTGAGGSSNVVWDLGANTASSMFGSINMLSNQEFGFYFKSDGDYFYSQSQFNPGSFDAFGLYWQTNPFDINNLYVYAQDNDTGRDHDYMYVGASDVKQVPEPGSLALASFGLLALAYRQRKIVKCSV